MYNISSIALEQGINVAGIIFYIIVIFGILKHFTTFGTAYMPFILTVAFQDLVVLLTAILFNFSGSDFQSTVVFKAAYVLFYVCIISELLIHTVIAFNRLIAIVFFQYYKSIFTKKFSLHLIALCFLLTILFTICNALMTDYISDVINIVLNIVCWLSTILMYAVAGVVSTLRTRKSVIHQNTEFRRELRLFVQAAFVAFVMSLLLISQFIPECSISLLIGVGLLVAAHFAIERSTCKSSLGDQ
uniref:G-protein coupled receptors family 1 profile domain-containing protein n=1 Tax=Romanomermis culicivorax TaxID=13658 RepID=A0A915IVD5_ROMCU